MNGHCTTQHSHGDYRPSWARTQASVSFLGHICRNNGCNRHTHFHQNYADFSKPVASQEATFNLNCENDWCTIQQCIGTTCWTRERVSKAEVERDVARLPRCNQINRGKRSIIASLHGFCCNIVEHGGITKISIHKINSIGWFLSWNQKGEFFMWIIVKEISYNYNTLIYCKF